jgi:hypothetical protein
MDSGQLQFLSDLIKSLIPSHVRSKENQIVDDLANIGIDLEGMELICQASIHRMHPILQRCKEKAVAIDSSPDGVIVQLRCQMERIDDDHHGTNHVTCTCPSLPSAPCIYPNTMTTRAPLLLVRPALAFHPLDGSVQWINLYSAHVCPPPPMIFAP